MILANLGEIGQWFLAFLNGLVKGVSCIIIIIILNKMRM